MRFRVLDFETTGFPPVASVCEVGYTDVVWDPVLDPSVIDTIIHPTQTQMCKPSHHIELEAMAVHHITEPMVAGAPHNRAVLEALEKNAQRLGVDIWVAHNNEFERKFFNPPEARWICTYKSALSIWPEAPKHTNQVLRYFLELGLESELCEPTHRAGPDTYVTAHILIRALQKRTVDELIALTGQPTVMQIVPFGKHKGKRWQEVPHDYMEWLLGQPTVTSDVRATCQYWLKQPVKSPA